MVKYDVYSIITALELYSNEFRVLVTAIKDNNYKDDIEFRVIQLQLEQIYDIYSSIIVLIKEKKISSVNALLRVLFESYVQFCFIIQDKDTVSSKIMVYSLFMYKQELKNLEMKKDITDINTKIGKELIAQITGINKRINMLFGLIKNDELKNRFKNRRYKNNWYSIYANREMKIRDLAKEVKVCNSSDKNWSLFYDDLYQQLSMYIHGYKGFEAIGSPINEEELYKSVVYLVATASSFIFDDLFSWLNKLGYINDKINYSINYTNLALAQNYIKSTCKPENKE